MSELVFTKKAWEDYTYWQTQDKKTLRKINVLLREIQRDVFTGIGAPEELRHEFSGYWSRKIDETNRLVYEILADGNIRVIMCRGHYDI